MGNLTNKNRATHFGKLGWGLIIFTMACFVFGSSFWPGASANVLVPVFSERLGFSDTSTVLFVNSAVTYISIAIVFVVGWLLVRVKTRLMNAILLVLNGIGVIIVPYVHTVAAYMIVWVIVIGCACSLGQTTLNAQIGTYMPTKNGSALGWATIGLSCAAIVGVPILNALMSSVGFAIAMLILGAYLCIMGILNFILWPNDPAKRGYELDNGDISPEQLQAIKEARERETPNWSVKEMLSNKNFWCIALGYGLNFMTGALIGGQMIVFLVQNGMQMNVAVTIFSVTGLVAIGGSLISGYIAQLFSVRGASCLMVAFYALAAISSGFFQFGKATPVLMLIGYGFVMGAGNNLPASHGFNCFGTDFQRAWRFVGPIITAFSGTGGIVLGVAQRLTGSYAGAYKVCLFFCAGSLIFFLVSDTRMNKEPGKPPVVIRYGDKRLAKMEAKKKQEGGSDKGEA